MSDKRIKSCPIFKRGCKVLILKWDILKKNRNSFIIFFGGTHVVYSNADFQMSHTTTLQMDHAPYPSEEAAFYITTCVQISLYAVYFTDLFLYSLNIRGSSRVRTKGRGRLSGVFWKAGA